MRMFVGSKLIAEILKGSGITSMSGGYIMPRVKDGSRTGHVQWIALEEERVQLRQVMDCIGLADVELRIVKLTELEQLELTIGDRLLHLSTCLQSPCSRWKVTSQFSPCYE